MSIVGKLLGEAGAGTARGLLDGFGDLATKIRSAITGDLPPEMRLELEKLATEADNLKTRGQLEINAIEAQNPSLFVSGWRPFIGWVCGLALAWSKLVYPMVIWIMPAIWPTYKPPPQISMADLMPILVGMLGFGVYRTYEKVKGVGRN